MKRCTNLDGNVDARDYQRIYQRGFSDGRRGSWPDTRPPLPPDPVVRALVAALQKLRDACDAGCATFSEDDEFVLALNPAIASADEALMLVTVWLLAEEAAPPS